MTSYRQGQFEPNIAAIEAGTGKPVLTAAWPCGNNDPGRRTAADAYFVATRGYFDPDHPTNPNYGDTPWTNDVNEATPVEWQNLWAGGYYTQSHIDRAASEGKWAIIVSHGSCVGISYMGQRKDVLWAAPVGEVAKYIKVRDAAVFSNYTRSGETISFDVVHTLPVFPRTKVDGNAFLPVVYDNPVTLSAHVQDLDIIAGVTVDGATVPYSVKVIGGVRYVLFDAALNASRHVVIGVTRDTTLPTIVARTPAPDSTNVVLDTNLTVQFSEAMNPATVSASTVRLRAAGAPEDVPVIVTYSGTPPRCPRRPGSPRTRRTRSPSPTASQTPPGTRWGRMPSGRSAPRPCRTAGGAAHGRIGWLSRFATTRAVLCCPFGIRRRRPSTAAS